MQGAGTLGWPLARFLGALRDAGLGSLPGTAAEVLDDAVRRADLPRQAVHRAVATGRPEPPALGLPPPLAQSGMCLVRSVPLPWCALPHGIFRQRVHRPLTKCGAQWHFRACICGPSRPPSLPTSSLTHGDGLPESTKKNLRAVIPIVYRENHQNCSQASL